MPEMTKGFYQCRIQEWSYWYRSIFSKLWTVLNLKVLTSRLAFSAPSPESIVQHTTLVSSVQKFWYAVSRYQHGFPYNTFLSTGNFLLSFKTKAVSCDNFQKILAKHSCQRMNRCKNSASWNDKLDLEVLMFIQYGRHPKEWFKLKHSPFS